MKKRIEKRLSFLLLTLLGFSTACEKLKKEETPPDMYGPPPLSYTFQVQGKITDTAGTPIPGIEVKNEYNTKVHSGTDGTYLIEEHSSANYKPALTFTDIDGPANGGEFAEKTVGVEFTEADRTEKGDGSFARTGVDVTLKEKK